MANHGQNAQGASGRKSNLRLRRQLLDVFPCQFSAGHLLQPLSQHMHTRIDFGVRWGSPHRLHKFGHRDNPHADN
jgi:hypothetical protein